MAHHLTEAGQTRRPRSTGGRARRVARASASRAARPWPTCGGRSSSWPTLPEGPERDGHELGLQMGLCALLPSVSGYASAETEQAYLRAQELCDRAGRVADNFYVHHGLWAFHLVCGRLEVARERAQALARGGARARRHALGPRRPLRARLHARRHRRDRGRSPPPRARDGRGRSRPRPRPELPRGNGAGHHDTRVRGDAAVAARPPRRGAGAGQGHGRQGARARPPAEPGLRALLRGLGPHPARRGRARRRARPRAREAVRGARPLLRAARRGDARLGARPGGGAGSRPGAPHGRARRRPRPRTTRTSSASPRACASTAGPASC